MGPLIAYCCTYLMKIKLPLTTCLKIAKVFPARKKQVNKQTERQTKNEQSMPIAMMRYKSNHKYRKYLVPILESRSDSSA